MAAPGPITCPVPRRRARLGDSASPPVCHFLRRFAADNSKPWVIRRWFESLAAPLTRCQAPPPRPVQLPKIPNRLPRLHLIPLRRLVHPRCNRSRGTPCSGRGALGNARYSYFG